MDSARYVAIVMHGFQLVQKSLVLAEVAAELNCSKPAVAGLLHRGLEKLRELLAEMQS